MVSDELLKNNACALVEAHLTLSRWDTRENCCQAMQVIIEVALLSVAQNEGLGRALSIMAAVIKDVAESTGADVSVDVIDKMKAKH